MINLGCWKRNGIVICDSYADAIEKDIDMARDNLKKKFPTITGKQMAETISFVAGRLKMEK